MSARQSPSELASAIVKNVTNIKTNKHVRQLGTKSTQLALEVAQVESQGMVEDSTAMLEKILKHVQLWSTETSVASGRKSEIRKEVERWNSDLDQLIKQVQENTMSIGSLLDESESSESEDPMRPESEGGGLVTATPARDDSKAALIALFTLASILSTPEKSRALEGLKGGRAQIVINFLHGLLSEPANTSMPWLRKHAHVALRGLCGSSVLYPSWYVLEGITDIKPRFDGGTFSDIFRGKQGSLEVCLKRVRVAGTGLADVLRHYAKEAIVWGQLHHPNILPFFGIFYLDGSKEDVCLVSPWIENGSLEAYLNCNPDAPRKPLVRDVALGLAYLHDENIIHGDLKTMNILVYPSGQACIGGFGSSIICVDRTLGFTNVTGSASSFTERWASPELLREEAHSTRASDVWAFGCVCYEILSRRLPFHSVRGPHASLRILLAVSRGLLPARRDKEPEADPRDRIDEESWELMNRCWSQDPEARPACLEILNELERQGVGQRDDEMQDTANPATITSTGTGKADLGEVQGILDEIDSIESAFNPVSEARDTLSTNRRLSEILSSVLGDPQKNQALQELKDDRAQLLVDFLSFVSTRSFLFPFPEPDLAARAAATVCQLSESRGLYPRRYMPNEVTWRSEPLAKGFCDVYQGFHGEQPLCVKVLKEVDVGSVPKTFMKEVIQWARFDHPNILPLYGIHCLGEGPRQLCVVTPWRERRTLREYLEQNVSVAREDFICDIVSGLTYLHGEDVVHGRLKMSNVLVDYWGRACITDLGMLTVRSAYGAVEASTTGRPSWSAPELLGGEPCSKPCDIWAFGCVCYEVLTSKELPRHPTDLENPITGLDEIADEMQGLIRSCLAREPGGRPTAQKILQWLEDKGLRQRQEEIQSYLVHRDGVIKARMANRSLTTIEKLLRVQYILHKVNGDKAIPDRGARDPLATSDHLIRLLTSVFRTAHKRKALRSLRNGHAQLMLDFVDLIASHPELQTLRLRQQRYRLLSQLSATSGLYPRSFLLKDVVDSGDNQDLRGDVRKGHYREQPLHLQAVWIRNRAGLGFTAEALARTVALWSHLSHPNITPFYGAYLDDAHQKQLYLVSPWMANGNLRQFLDANPSGPRRALVYDVAQGIRYLHSQDIVHRNLQAGSVVVNDIGRACITYFPGAWLGPGTSTATISSLVTEGLNPSWQAPESLGDEYQVTAATDIWRFGCVCYEVTTRRKPYYHIRSAIETLRAIFEHKLPIRPVGDSISGLDKIDDDMWDLMNRCWAREPEDRPTADQIVEELESWGLGRHEDDDFQDYVLQEHQISRYTMRKYPNVEIDFAKVEQILEEVDGS